VVYSKGVYFINLKTNKIDFILENYLKQSATQNKILDNFIYCGDLEGNIIKFNIQDNSIKLFGIKEPIRAININPFQKTIYFATFKGNIFILDNSNNIKKINFTEKFIDNYYKKESDNTITCLQIVYNKFLIFSNINGYIFIFDILNDMFLYSFKAHFEQTENKDLNFGSLHLRSEIWTFKIYEKSILNDVKDDNDKGNFYLATGSEDQTVKIYNIIYTNKKNFSNKHVKTIKNHKLAVTCIDIGKKLNTEILISCSDDKTINIYNCLKSYELIYNYNFKQKLNGFFTLTYLSLDDLNENNNLLCIGTQNGFVIIFDISTKKINFLEKTHYGGIEGLSFYNNMISTTGNDNMLNIFKILS
jgi:WD40 repeat protein